MQPSSRRILFAYKWGFRAKLRSPAQVSSRTRRFSLQFARLQPHKSLPTPSEPIANFLADSLTCWLADLLPRHVGRDTTSKALASVTRFSISSKHPNPGDRHGGTMLHQKRLKKNCVRRPQSAARKASDFRPFGYVRSWNLHFFCVPGERRRCPRHANALIKRPRSCCPSAPFPRSLNCYRLPA
jgi:hypothetical protein